MLIIKDLIKEYFDNKHPILYRLKQNCGMSVDEVEEVIVYILGRLNDSKDISDEVNNNVYIEYQVTR